MEGFHARMEESSDAFNAMQNIYEARDSLATVRLFFITDGVVKSLELEEEQFPNIDVKYAVWDLEKLSCLRTGKRSIIELDLVNDYGGAIPCILTTDPTGEYRTFLTFFRAPMLARIYGEYGQRLLERNVRAFLQAKGKVNKGLQKTLKEEPHRFLAYNNGLCCTASDIRIHAGKDDHARIEWLKDFQIVNGGQTTASIYHAVKKLGVNIEHVVVQIKLTVLKDPAKVNEIVPLISRYANSQNKVNGADFAANGAFHNTMEQLSRTVWAPAVSGLERGTHWYYERARGSYNDDKAQPGTAKKRSEWETQNPSRQKFTKTDLAKFEHAWMGLPYLVCLHAEKNFNKMAERMAEDGEPVVDQSYFKHSVSKAIIWRTTEKLFDSLEFDGYRYQTVAYTIAWLAEHSARRIDLDKIWNDQRCSQHLCDALKAVCEKAYKHITDQEGNPGEVCKRESCWREFAELSLDLPNEWKKELSDKTFVPTNSEEEALSAEWERVRHEFVNDSRTIGDLEALTGKVWMPSRRGDPVCFYAEQTWDKLRSTRFMGLKKLRGLVEMYATAVNN
jgi:hypothetical protein